MPLFQVDIEKRLASEYWTNRWIVNAGDLSASLAYAGLLVTAERELHSDLVTFTRYRASSLTPGDGVYTVQPIGLNGMRNVTQVLPLFNTLRMDFNAVTGRPSRKYFRACLGESEINGEVVDTSFFVGGAGSITNLFATVEDPDGVVDPQGQRLTATVIWPFVQMRQLRRSRRRRANGGGIFQ